MLRKQTFIKELISDTSLRKRLMISTKKMVGSSMKHKVYA